MVEVDRLMGYVVRGSGVLVTVVGQGVDYRWRIEFGESTDSGSWVGDPLEAEAFALMVADEELSSTKLRHRGQIFAASVGRSGLGMVLEASKKGDLFDTKLRFPSQAAASEYVEEVKRSSGRGTDTCG